MNKEEVEFGIQYGYQHPHTKLVVPLPFGMTFQQAVVACLNYNRAKGLKANKDRYVIVERQVTPWVEAVQPDSEAKADEQRVQKLDTAFGKSQVAGQTSKQ